MEVQTTKTLLKTIAFAFGLFCLLMTYASGVRLYEHLLLVRSATLQLNIALDIGGNVLLLIMSGLGVVTVFLIIRRGLDRIVRDWPYVLPGILVALFWATVAAALGARRMTWVLPSAGLWGLVGLWAGWSVLRKHGLPISARVSDVPVARRQNETEQ